MPDDNRFSGLGEQIDDADDKNDEDQADDQEPAATPQPDEPDQEATMDATETRTPSTAAQDATDTPAFDFDSTKQDALYPLSETWQEFEDALDFEVRRALRDDGYTNIEKRELHEATLRVAIENPELVAEQVRLLRRE